MKVKQLDHLNLTVRSFDDTVEFYGRVFGFEIVEEAVKNGVRWGVIRSGEAMLCIYEHPKLEFLDRFALLERGLHGVNHLAFRITDAKAWYIKDPTGYEIEVTAWNDDEIAFD